MPAARALIRKLESVFDLTSEERRTIESLPVRLRDVKAGEALVRDGDRPSHCCVVIAGFACRSKLVEKGGRQIMSFHIAGDIPDLQSLHLDVMDHDLGMLRAGKVAFLAHGDVRAMNERHPRIAAALWRSTLIDAAIFRQWIVGIGRKSAYGRVAHLIGELLVLARSVGLADDVIEQSPTQEELGDALGLSVVHVNRTLRALREDGLVTTKSRRIVVLDWEGLKKAGEFDPAYLHVKAAA
jgi:CRP-like cAMP-binding protein